MGVIKFRAIRMYYLYTASLSDLSRDNSEGGDSDSSDYEVYRSLGWNA